MLTPEQQKLREGRITASFIPALMAGDEQKILSEWMRIVEHPDYVAEDLSGVWPVRFGSFIEAFALDWHQMKTGQALTHRGLWVPHPQFPHVGSTLDAYRTDDDSVIDCKAPGRWRKLEDVIDYYPGQLVVQRACTQARRAALLVVHGGDEPKEYEVGWDDAYEGEVWSRIDWFWQRVESLQPPCAIPAAKVPVPAVRQVDMQGSNEWATFAHGWLVTRDAAKTNAEAAKALKGMVEEDVAKAFGHGVLVTRSRAGALTIKQGAH